MDTSEQNVTETQELAIESLLHGQTATAAAEAAGVSRTTLWRWSNEDPVFAAELSRRRNEVRAEIRERLLQIAHHAADVVEASILSGDAKSAMELIKGLGFLNGDGAKNTEDDPDEIEQKIRSKKCYLKTIKELHE